MKTGKAMLVTAPLPLWQDIDRYMGKTWDAVAVPMVDVRRRDDRKFPQLAQQLTEGRFSIVVFVNLLSARFALQGPSHVVQAAALGMRDLLVVAQAPEVARELSGLTVKPVIPVQSNLYDFLDEHSDLLKDQNLLVFSGESFNPLIAVAMKRLGARVEQLTTYSSRMLYGKEQKEAIDAVLDDSFMAVSFESRIAVESFFSVTPSRERRRLVRVLDGMEVRAQNPVIADALASRGVNAWVPDTQDFKHLFA